MTDIKQSTLFVGVFHAAWTAACFLLLGELASALITSGLSLVVVGAVAIAAMIVTWVVGAERGPPDDAVVTLCGVSILYGFASVVVGSALHMLGL